MPFAPPKRFVRRSTHLGTRYRYMRFHVGLVWPNRLYDRELYDRYRPRVARALDLM